MNKSVALKYRDNKLMFCIIYQIKFFIDIKNITTLRNMMLHFMYYVL